MKLFPNEHCGKCGCFINPPAWCGNPDCCSEPVPFCMNCGDYCTTCDCADAKIHANMVQQASQRG